MAAAVAAAAVPVATAADAGRDPVPVALAPVTVPDVVEDRRTDAAGTIVVRKYMRGKMLGKVRARARFSPPPRAARARARALAVPPGQPRFYARAVARTRSRARVCV